VNFHTKRPLIWKWFLWILLHLELSKFTSRELDLYIRDSGYKLLAFKPSRAKLVALERMGIIEKLGMNEYGLIVYRVKDPVQLRQLYKYVCSLCAKKPQ